LVMVHVINELAGYDQQYGSHAIRSRCSDGSQRILSFEVCVFSPFLNIFPLTLILYVFITVQIMSLHGLRTNVYSVMSLSSLCIKYVVRKLYVIYLLFCVIYFTVSPQLTWAQFMWFCRRMATQICNFV